MWLLRASGGAERPLSPTEALGAAGGAERSYGEVISAILKAIASFATAGPTSADTAQELASTNQALRAASTPSARLRVGHRLLAAQRALEADWDPLASEVAELVRAFDQWSADDASPVAAQAPHRDISSR